ncbi:MAG: hypothetical protein CME55_02910 [Halieaceae bacterium]|nr:hypothetical protein [Halieaceae bacterium]
MLLFSKLLSLLIYPLSLCLFLLLLALLLSVLGARAKANWLTVLASAWLYFCATEFGAATLSEPLEEAYPAFANEELPDADAIVVLGGGITGESRYGLGGDFNEAADRLWRAADLYRGGKAPIIVLSGGTSLEGTVSEAQLMDQKLRGLGLTEAAWIEEPESRNTRENGKFTRVLLEGSGVNHILLVTSATHMRRASAVFTSQGFVVTAVATDHQLPLTVGPVPGWLPTHERLARSTRAIHEWVGYWVYNWFGYLSPESDAVTAR